LFDELATSKVEKVKQQANQPHQQIQAKLATAQIEYIVSNILDTLILSNEASENQSANNQFDWDLRLNEKTPADKISAQFLRFAAHFVLFCSSTGEKQDEQAAQMILKAYIRHLIKHSQLKLVPIYVSRLPEKAAVSVFCQFLSTIERSSTDRELALKLILQYADEQILTQVAQQTVEQLLLSLKETQVQVDASNKHTISVLDHKRMKSLEFLCVYDRHRSIALAQANRLAKEFVLEGKFEAVRELFVDILPEDSLDMINLQREELTNEWIDRCLREYLSWKAFICAFDVYQVWRECVSTGATLTRATYNEEKDFMTELCYHASAAGSALVDILHFENGWMQLCASSEEDDTKVYAAIRRKCLPQLVFHLHYVQLETAKIVMRLKFYPQDAKIQVAKPLLEKSMQVADIVADEHYGVYKALDEHQCRDLLDKIRESAIALLFVQEQQPQEETFEPQQRRTSASSSNSTLRSLRTS
jgi:nuclear pore complex protein Nup107